MKEIKYLKLNIVAIVLLGVLVFLLLFQNELLRNRVSTLEDDMYKIKIMVDIK